MAADSKPIKGILKNSQSFDQAQDAAQDEKKMKWDEMNILATYHPPGKDYGHMKIDDPPTPYHHNDGTAEEDDLDPESLATRLESDSKPRVLGSPREKEDSSSGEEDEDCSAEELEKRKVFEQKRKLHYNEFQAVKLARKLLDDAEDEEEDEDKEEEKEEKKEEVATESSQS